MSRNDGKKDSSASTFRKIDVDQYSDNNFREEDADGGIGGPTGPDENEILTLLSQYPFHDILLRSAPLGCKNQQVKDNARNLTVKVLLSIKSTQIDDCLAQFDRDLLDVLMKYIYRGFEIPTEDSKRA
ncbi:Actin-related protein 2/3 complex subunit 5-like protein [Anthophora quadrimaculata]